MIDIDLNIPPNILKEINNTLLEYRDKQEQSFVDNGKIKTDTRNCVSCDIPPNNWFVGMLAWYVQRLNDQYYHYDLTTFDNDCLQYITYIKNHYYKWHIDVNTPPPIHDLPKSNSFRPNHTLFQRKLSFSLMLNDDYEGGELQVMSDFDQMVTIRPKAGTLVVFDSRSRHRVRPVKTGRRDSLVGWMVGPHWK